MASAWAQPSRWAFWGEDSLQLLAPCLPGRTGAEVGERLISSQYRKEGGEGAHIERQGKGEGATSVPSKQKKSHRQSQMRGAQDLKGVGVASPRLRVSCAEGRGRGELVVVGAGPTAAAAAAGGGWGEAVFRCGEGLRRGLGPPCPLPVPDQGFCVPSGVGLSLLRRVGQSGPMGGAGPAPI